MWVHPAAKASGTKYYGYVLVYVNDVLCISHDTLQTVHSLQGKPESGKFKLKGDAIIVPEIYLGGDLCTMINENSQQCWAMSSDKYCTSAVANVEEVLSNKRTILDILSQTTGQEREKIEKDMDRIFYMSPHQAVDYGLIDRVFENKTEMENNVSANIL